MDDTSPSSITDMGTDELTEYIREVIDNAMLGVRDDCLYPESKGWAIELDDAVNLINKAIRDWEYDAH